MFTLQDGYYKYRSMYLGLKELNPAGGIFANAHHPVHGWNLVKPKASPQLKILLQDDLTFSADNKCVEIENYLEYYKENIKYVQFYTWHYGLGEIYPKLNIFYYPFFFYEYLNCVKDHKIVSMFNFLKKTKKFLCLNGNRRSHRQIVVDRIKNKKNCFWSYRSKNIGNIPNEMFTKEDYYNAKNAFQANVYNLISCKELYNHTCFSLVTETRYKLPLDFVTEKTLQCILALHPALYVSNRYHVKHLRDNGFDVFDDIFDHSYDYLDDDNRITKLLNDNMNVLDQGISINDNIKARLLVNRDHLLGNFHHKIFKIIEKVP